jgi:hypothetical protein
VTAALAGHTLLQFAAALAASDSESPGPQAGPRLQVTHWHWQTVVISKRDSNNAWLSPLHRSDLTRLGYVFARIGALACRPGARPAAAPIRAAAVGILNDS